MFREFPLPESTGPVTFHLLLRPQPRSPHYRRTRQLPPPFTEATRATYLRPSLLLLFRFPFTTSTRRTDSDDQRGDKPQNYYWRNTLLFMKKQHGGLAHVWNLKVKNVIKYHTEIFYIHEVFTSFFKTIFSLVDRFHTFLRDLQWFYLTTIS